MDLFILFMFILNQEFCKILQIEKRLDKLKKSKTKDPQVKVKVSKIFTSSTII